jgi:hypothetical protein
VIIADPTFAAAIYPDTWRVGNVVLQSYSLGHAVLLQRLGNAYATCAAEGRTMGALVLAAWICSRPAHIAARRVDGWWTRQWLVRQALVWRASHADRDAEMQLYLGAAWNLPGTRATRASGRSAGADPLHLLWLHRRQIMGDTESQAAACPVLRARLDLIAWAEQEGAIDIVDAAQEDGLLQASIENAQWDRELRKAGNGQ